MRRMGAFVLLVLCFILLCAPVRAADLDETASSAETAAAEEETAPLQTEIPVSNSQPRADTITSYTMEAVVNQGGTAQISAVVDIHLSQSTEKLVIPLGKGASNCVVNGVRLRIRQINGIPSVYLTSDVGLIGDLRVSMTYQVSKCVSADGVLTLPVLPAGYAYPIERLTADITLPGTFSQRPQFSSGYLGEDVDNYMNITVSDNRITAELFEPMRDHDSMILTLQTPEAMFARQTRGGTLETVGMIVGVLLGLMLLYWALTLSWRPVRVGFQTHPPLGETAGESAALLTGGNLSFSLMVLTWAQMGYLTIHRGRDVTLRRRMEMGNERSELEIRAFRRLFRQRLEVSATGSEFQRLRQRMDGCRPRMKDHFHPRSGNPLLLRLMGAALGGAAAVGIGDGLLPAMPVRVLVLILCALAGLWAAWKIQAGVHALFGRDRAAVVRGALVCLAVLALSGGGGQFGRGVVMVLAEALAGLASAFGGRRTEEGRQIVQGELGMIRFFRWGYKEQHQTNQARNPSYYYDLAPYALALGADRAFARRFEKTQLPPCTYLRCQVKDGTARQWCKVLRETVDLMDGKPIGLERYFLGRVLMAFLIARQSNRERAARDRERRRRAERAARQRENATRQDTTQRMDFADSRLRQDTERFAPNPGGPAGRR